MDTCGPHTIDNTPLVFKWDVIRGDTAKLKVEFLENDETTYVDISTWDFVASVYDSSTSTREQLDIIIETGYVELIADPFITETWGIGSDPLGTVASIKFDLQVITSEDVTWTPVIGTINVVGDISGSTL